MHLVTEELIVSQRLKLSKDELIHFSDRWPYRYSRYWRQPENCCNTKEITTSTFWYINRLSEHFHWKLLWYYGYDMYIIYTPGLFGLLILKFLATIHRQIKTEKYFRKYPWLLNSDRTSLKNLSMRISQSAWAVEYTDSTSERGQPLLPKIVLDMTLHNLMVMVPLMLDLWGMWSTPSLPSLPSPLWLGVVAPDRVLSMG